MMTLAANAQKHVGQLGKGDFGSETLVEGTILLGHAQVLVQIGSHLKPRGKVAVMYLLYSCTGTPCATSSGRHSVIWKSTLSCSPRFHFDP